MWEQQLLFSHSLHTLPCVKQLCLLLLCHRRLLPVNPGELKQSGLRQQRREATKQAGVKLSSPRRRPRHRWHVSAELLPCNRAAAASKGERLPRPPAPEPARPATLQGTREAFPCRLPWQGADPRAPCRAGRAGAGLQASQGGSEPWGRLRRGLQGLHWARGTGMLPHPAAAGSSVMGKPHHARTGAAALPGASQGQQRCDPHGTGVPPALQTPRQEKDRVQSPCLPAPPRPPRRWRQCRMRLRGPASRTLCLPS